MARKHLRRRNILDELQEAKDNSQAGNYEKSRVPMSPLADCMVNGMASVGRAGNKVRHSQPPKPTFVNINGFNYVQDLVPDLASSRAVQLAVDDIYAAQTTLCISYPRIETQEINQNIDPEIGSLATRLRDFKIWIEFGVAAGRHNVIVDVSEGNICSIPAAGVFVSIYDCSIYRTASGGFFTQNQDLVSIAHLSSLGPPTTSVCTDRVYAPAEVSLDLNNTPTIDGWLKLLREEACNPNYLGPTPE